MFTPKLVVCLREGYDRERFLADLFAGVTVGIVALPLAMAFGIASGVTPERGLFTAIVAGFVISVLGGSRVQIGGPTGAFVVIVYGIVQKHGYDGLAVATLLAGAILVAMGLARFGTLIKFIPYPVTTGFTSGIAVIIFSSQVKDLLGLRMDAVPAEFLEKWGAYLTHLTSWNPSAAALAAGSIAIILACKRFTPKVPGPIVAVVAASLAAWALSLPVDTIGTRFGGIPRLLPAPHLPHVDFAQLRALVPEAFTIAMLGAIESLLSAVVADGMTGGRHRSNIELIAQGTANVASVIFGGIPATGAIARTATNVRSGAKTPVAGIVHAMTLGAFMFFLAPLASAIPLAALAAVLVIVAWNMAEVDHFRTLLRAPKSDIAVLLTAFLLTVLVDLTVAVEVGLVMAAMLFMRRMSEVTDVRAILEDSSDEDSVILPEGRDPDATANKQVPRGVKVFEINGPFFFGVADKLKDTLDNIDSPPKLFILRMRRVPAIDATGLHALEEFWSKCARHGTVLLLSGLREQPLAAIERVGLADKIGRQNLHRHIDEALSHARALLAR